MSQQMLMKSVSAKKTKVEKVDSSQIKVGDEILVTITDDTAINKPTFVKVIDKKVVINESHTVTINGKQVEIEAHIQNKFIVETPSGSIYPYSEQCILAKQKDTR